MAHAGIASEILGQYDRAFAMFRELIEAFPEASWDVGIAPLSSPRRWGLHALQATDFYARLRPEDVDRRERIDWEGPLETLPDREALLVYADMVQRGLHHAWSGQPDEFMLAPTAFEWTGASRLGQHLYSLRHFLFHLGELSMLARQSGSAESPWH